LILVFRQTIAIVYEIEQNPHFSKVSAHSDSPLYELVKPEEINRLKQALGYLGYNTKEFDGPLGLLENIQYLKARGDTVVFNKSRGYTGLERKIFVPAICNMYHLPFVGTSAYPMTLARHKFHTNLILSALGLKVPVAAIYYPRQKVTDFRLDFPVILKPNHESGALGITENSVFNSFRGINDAVEDLYHRFNQPVIIEEYIDGEEWKVAVIGNRPSTRALGCVGVMKGGKQLIGSLQSRQDVVGGNLEYYLPDNLDLVKEALTQAVTIHDAMECNDYSRCDFRINTKGELICMEVSTHPELNYDSSFIRAAFQSYPDYESVIHDIVQACLSRYVEHKHS